MSLGFLHERVEKKIFRGTISSTSNTLTSDVQSEVQNNDRIKIIKPIILGSVDGVITSFVIIAGGIAGSVVKNSVLIIGLSSLFADGFSMGASEYLSSRNDKSIQQSFVNGSLCFLSFIIFGSIPLLTFFLANNFQFGVSIISFLCSLFLITILQSYILGKLVYVFITEIFVIGSFVGSLAYLVAYISARSLS